MRLRYATTTPPTAHRRRGHPLGLGALVLAMLIPLACDDAGDEAAAGETRVVETATGEVEIPATVERIVTTHNIATQPLIDLGVEPVGIGGVTQDELYPDYWQQISDIEQVSTGTEINLEVVSRLEPDVIFAMNAMPEDALDRLRQIAPVIAIGIRGPARADWQGRAELVAEVTERQDELEELAAEYTDRAEALAGEYGSVLEQHTFNVLDSYEEGTVIPYGPSSMVGNIIVPAGATFAPSASTDMVSQIDEDPTQTVASERLPELADGSVILHGSRAVDDEPTATQRAMLDSPLFARSEAAEADRVFPIGKTLIAGYGDAFALLDRFERALHQLAG